MIKRWVFNWLLVPFGAACGLKLAFYWVDISIFQVMAIVLALKYMTRFVFLEVMGMLGDMLQDLTKNGAEQKSTNSTQRKNEAIQPGSTETNTFIGSAAKELCDAIIRTINETNATHVWGFIGRVCEILKLVLPIVTFLLIVKFFKIPLSLHFRPFG